MLVKTRRQGTMTGKKGRPIGRGTEVGRCWAGLTDAVQPVDGDGFKGAAHHWVLLQHLVEVVDGEREESAVRVGAHAGRPPPLGQQADLCRVEGAGGEKERARVRERERERDTRQSKDLMMGNEC